MAELMLRHGLWVMVADGEKALFLKNSGNLDRPKLDVVRRLKEENPPNRDQGADRPGRMSDGPGAHRSAVEETDWHRISKERFADEIAGRLYGMSHRGDFDEIVLVAPPIVLGEIRRKLHKEVASKVVAEVPKTLTNHAVAEIGSILQGA